MNDDLELLRRYAQDGSEQAFAELVSRHLGLVYHAALRQVDGDARRAEDVAQTVFIDLARKAASLARNPLLVGWLHTSTRYAAANLRRAEHRRQIREQEVYAMNETPQTSATETEPSWEHLRPVIDDALHVLGERDREAVLLRFFEGRSFSAIGAKLSVTEDAARVRVDRALEKIRRTLVRRGVTSTSAALAAALAGQAGVAAPAGLAAQISATALAAGVGVGAGVAGIGLFTFMTTTKTVALMGALLVVSAGIALREGVENKGARASLAAERRNQAELRAKVHDLEEKLAAASARVRAAEEEGATLLGVLDDVAKEKAVGPEKPAAPVTRELVQARYKRAKELAQTGRAEEALKEFLWCHDEGMVRIGSFAGVRQSALLNEIATLGKTHPPALEALRQYRDKAERAMMAGATDTESASTFSSMNRILGESARTLRFWEQLAPDDERRGTLGYDVFESLAASRRYKDAAQAVSYRHMSLMFESMTYSLSKSTAPKGPDSEKWRQDRRASIAQNITRYIEVLTGAGDLEHARELAGRLLKLDDSPQTLATVRQGLANAGQPNLLESTSP